MVSSLFCRDIAATCTGAARAAEAMGGAAVNWARRLAVLFSITLSATWANSSRLVLFGNTARIARAESGICSKNKVFNSISLHPDGALFRNTAKNCEGLLLPRHWPEKSFRNFVSSDSEKACIIFFLNISYLFDPVGMFCSLYVDMRYGWTSLFVHVIA